MKTIKKKANELGVFWYGRLTIDFVSVVCLAKQEIIVLLEKNSRKYTLVLVETLYILNICNDCEHLTMKI